MPQAVTESESPWVIQGVVAGVTGAAVIALFFLLIDLLAGRPLWTPTALGSQLFLGQTLTADAEPRLALVAAYTIVHGIVFIGLGLIAAIAVGDRARLRPRGALAVGAAIFIGVEAFFLAVTGAFAPGLMATVGTGKVAFANLLAATAMSQTLVRPPIGRRESEDSESA